MNPPSNKSLNKRPRDYPPPSVLKNDNYVLDYKQPIHFWEACREGDVQLVRKMLKKHGGYIHWQNHDWVCFFWLWFLFCFCFLFFVFCFLFCFVLFCFVLFCFVLFCFVLFCFVLFCFVLFALLFFFVLFSLFPIPLSSISHLIFIISNSLPLFSPPLSTSPSPLSLPSLTLSSFSPLSPFLPSPLSHPFFLLPSLTLSSFSPLSLFLPSPRIEQQPFMSLHTMAIQGQLRNCWRGHLQDL